MWKKVEFGLLEDPPSRLEATDVCYYARDYTSGRGYAHSETNSLISNFKKGVEKKNTREWLHKLKAISRFASEAAPLFDTLKHTIYVAAIPSSKTSDDPAHDDRLECVIQQLAKVCQHVVPTSPIRRRRSMRAAHASGGDRPSPDEVFASLEWTGLPGPVPHLVLLDDVLTTGNTFKQCQKVLRQNSPQTSVVGVFWARTIWESTSTDC